MTPEMSELDSLAAKSSQEGIFYPPTCKILLPKHLLDGEWAMKSGEYPLQ